MRDNERQTLHAVSNNRVSGWTNTVHAMRDRKEQERIKKLEDAEVSFTDILL
jgi:hypothetical protein